MPCFEIKTTHGIETGFHEEISLAPTHNIWYYPSNSHPTYDSFVAGSDKMKLTRLEIFGFKTFAKKLDIRLSEGITSVVGPNGCGKTNVVDSIRWVLGEQRPSQIRLERMEDSIFKGSATRKQLGMAEVSLTIDNESGRLPVDMPEVTITRRLFRSGESEYLLNRKICRLADINDLFMDTGMGTDSYSVFELAMINSILSDKTEDRRHIFEEAAGVTKYKARRKAAVNRMLTIQDDLARVGDIVAELERRTESLRRQAQKASRYRSLRSELRSRTVAVASFEMGRFKKKADASAEELDAIRTLGAGLRDRVARMAGEAEILSMEMLGAERELGECASQVESVRIALSEREKELARLDSRIEHFEETAAKAREASRRNAEALEDIAEIHGRCAEALAETTARLEEVDRATGEYRERFGDFEIRAAEKDDAFRSLETECRRLEREIASSRNLIVTVRVRRETGETRLKEITRRIGELETSEGESAVECARLREDRSRNAAYVDGHERALGELTANLSAVAEELETIDRDLRDLRGREASLAAEREFLTDVIAGFEGYSEGVRNAASSDCLAGRVLGVLADSISADPPYLRAVGAALADSLQGLVVEDTTAALDGARYLASGGLGRAILLPLVAMHDAPDIFTTGENGVLGPAHMFVRTDERLAPLVRRLLGGTVVVDTIETAVRLRTRRGNGRYVALDGSIAGSCGELHAGTASDGGETTIGRRDTLNRITTEHDRASAELVRLERRRSERALDAESLRASIREREKAITELRRDTALLAEEEAGWTARRNAARETLASLKKEAGILSDSFAEYKREMETLDERIEQFSEHHHRVEERVKVTSAEIAELRKGIESRRARLNSCEVERAALVEKKSALERELAAAAERRESLAQSARSCLREIEDAERGMLESGERKRTILRELESLEEDHSRLAAGKDTLDRRTADIRARKSEIDRILQNARREQAEHAKRESALTLDRDEAFLRIRSIEERLSDEFFLTPAEIPEPSCDPDFDPEQERLLAEDIKRKIQTLGDVNMAAEADYREEKERLDFLVRERDDLLEARKTLDETIRRINHIARERFKETFERIRTNFAKTFADFFEGGFCDLALEEGEDPLEASILITARPPGKNVRSIGLLSSGERALTAISLLFAIYLVKPSPFCILDEVDAPLDDANIDRFLRVIREFSRSTQFIMVTHNKKTMAAADNLYGITMEEPGLSTLVSVRLSRTEQLKATRDAFIEEVSEAPVGS